MQILSTTTGTRCRQPRIPFWIQHATPPSSPFTPQEVREIGLQELLPVQEPEFYLNPAPQSDSRKSATAGSFGAIWYRAKINSKTVVEYLSSL